MLGTFAQIEQVGIVPCRGQEAPCSALTRLSMSIDRLVNPPGAGPFALPQKKTAEPLRAPPSLLELITYGPRSSVQQLHRSVHPLDPVARVTMSLRASLYGLLASTRSD